MSSSWEAAGLFIDKRGFILTDALAAVAVVSVLACSVSWSVLSHEKTVRLIEAKTEQLEKNTADFMKGIHACDLPCTEPEEDSSLAKH